MVEQHRNENSDLPNLGASMVVELMPDHPIGYAESSGQIVDIVAIHDGWGTLSRKLSGTSACLLDIHPRRR